MYKLLPQATEQKVRREYNMRRLVAILLAIIDIVIIGIVGLFPSYVLSAARHADVSSRKEALNEKHEGGELREWLINTNRKLSLISPELDKDSATKTLFTLLDLKPSGITVNNLAWKKTGDKTTANLTGLAKDRQTLINFERALRDSGKFSEVVLPLSNLAKDKNIDFQISLTQAT